MALNYNSITNDIRAVNELEKFVITKAPTLVQLISGIQAQYGNGTFISTNNTARNHKYEWLEDKLTPISSNVNTVTTQTSIIVADGSVFQVGDIIRFELQTNSTPLAGLSQITAISTNTLTLANDYGSTTTGTIATTHKAVLISRPYNKGSSAPAGKFYQSSTEYNYTQIFRESAELSGSDLATATYDKATTMAYQEQRAILKMLRELENSILFGSRVQRTSSVNGTMNGLIPFITDAASTVYAKNGALDEASLEEVFELIVTNGGGLNSNYAIICNPVQQRKLSAINTQGTNPIVYKETNDIIGNFAQNYLAPISVGTQNLNARIVSVPSFDVDKLAIIDLNNVAIVPMENRALIVEDATNNGDDGIKTTFTSELTLEVRNAGECHGLITGLTL